MPEIEKHVSIMDINFINTTKDNLLNHHIYPALTNNKKRFIVTANPEIVMRARANVAYKRNILRADYIIPDGIGIIIASKLLKQPIAERIPGFDLMLRLLDHAEEKGYRCYFLGAKESVIKRLISVLNENKPKLQIAGYHHGYIKENNQDVVEAVRKANPDLVFVAFGSPKQEKWITKHYQHFEKGVFMGVGGSFDVLAGEVKRAPDFWIKLNLEWFYRLIKQPFRLKRVIKVFEFIFRILIKKY
jgi:N-acetylglucosaminyldiphosphoundecaprenol N-acetyl-beta-D-mannosaminyltransferase